MYPKDSCVGLNHYSGNLIMCPKADWLRMLPAVHVLGNEEAVLLQSKQPGFFIESCSTDGNDKRCLMKKLYPKQVRSLPSIVIYQK